MNSYFSIKKYLILYCFVFATSVYFGQNNEKWIILVNNTENIKPFHNLKIYNYQSELRKIIASKIEEGYLTANIDSVIKNDSLKQLLITYYEGEIFEWAELNIENKDLIFFSKVGYGEHIYTNTPFAPKKLADLFNNSLTYLENNGYPFSYLKLDSINFKESKISANLKLQKGPKIIINSVFIKTDEKITIKTVYNFIKVKPGDDYNQDLINEINTRIKEVPYWEEIKPVEYEFINNKCNLYVYLKSKKSNNFNGVLGIQPSQNGKIGLTGDLKVKLLNSLYNGELIDLNWRQTQQLTQDLNLIFNYPFLFNTSFGLDTKFNIYKRDTSFVNTDVSLGVDYLFVGANKISVFFERKNAILLSTKKYENSTVLPDFADISKNNYGLKITTQKLDYRFNPRKGFLFETNVGVGTKNIKKNQALPSNLYDNLILSSLIYTTEANLSLFIPLFKRATIMTRFKGASLANENLFINELYRIGGIKTIRGFDEESIFASSYLISSIEYRYLLEQNANVYLFGDLGILEQNSVSKYSFDTPYSFGAGINFETTPGIFSLSYALGSQLNAPIYLRTAKIHFGFTSFF